MNSRSLAEITQRAGAIGDFDLVKQLEARTRVEDVIRDLRAEEKVVVLTDEEMQMVHEFRRFRSRMKKASAVFTWQTHIDNNKVEIVKEAAFIEVPNQHEALSQP